MYQSDDQLGWLEALPAKVGGEGSIPFLSFAAHSCTTRPLIRRAKAGPTLAFEWAEVAAFVWAGGGRADDGRCLPRPGDGIPPKIVVVAQAEAIGPRLWTESTEGTRDFADLLLRERGNLLANRETGFFLRGQQ